MSANLFPDESQVLMLWDNTVLGREQDRPGFSHAEFMSCGLVARHLE